MMTVLLLIICILSSGFTGNIYKKLSDSSAKRNETAATPSVWFLCLAVLFAVLSALSGQEFSAPLLLSAIPAGICIFVAAYTLLISMKVNAISVSVIIVNLNFIIPVVLSALVLREHTGAVQIIGMLLSITVIVLLNMGGGDDSCARKTGILLPVAACLSNGLFNFFIKVNESQGGSAFLFFAISYGTAALLSLTLGFALTVKERKARFPLGKGYLRRALAPMLLIGVCNGVCFYTARLLAERMNAAAQFTVVTCMSILLSLFVGFVFQGDKFNKKSALSIFFCIVALVCQYSGIA
jgi:drug/metabolite transporter (DMT)-like permease